MTSILIALLGFTIFSTGIVLTKVGNAWMKWPGRKDRRFAGTLAVWLLGFLLYNFAAVPTAIASRTLPPHVISAISGWSISVLVLLSRLLLKERLFKSDLLFSALLVGGIFILGIFDRSADETTINMIAFYILLLLPIILLLPLLLKALDARKRAILLAAFAGCAGGLALVVMNVVVKSLGFEIFAYFGSPFPYLYLICGISQFVGLQAAMRHGEMILVGPFQYSLMILYPIAASYFVFGTGLGLIQLVMIALIAFSCAAILRKH